MLGVLKTIWDIIFPFVLGGTIAFLTNVPMSFLEKKIFEKVKKKNKIVRKLERPISLILTIVLVVGVIALVMFGVIPQLTRTMGTLVTSINDFIPQMQSWIGEFFHNNQEIMNLVDQIEFDPDQAIKWGISLLGNGAGNIVIAGVIEAVGVIAGVVVYFVKSSLYENLLTKMLGRLALADVFTDITSNSIVDITGIALYLSLIVVFVFLTVQAIQKRRWN